MIYPVLLCGGSGKRLWPLSRQSYPKQFAQILDEISPFQDSAKRLSGEAFAPPLVIANAEFQFIIPQQLAAIGIDPGPVIVEPEGRNTGPAVLAAALHIAKTDPAAIMLVAPSDHLIPDPQAFRETVLAGLNVVGAGRLMTFGIHPSRPETGYGYLHLAEKAAATSAIPQDLLGFVEKPESERAAEMIASQRYLWNSGIFLFRADAIIAAFERHAMEIVEPVRISVAEANNDLGFLRLAAVPWAEVPAKSLDHAVMEKADNLSVIPYAGGWSDLGSWHAVWEADGKDSDGVSLTGNATAIDCRDSLLHGTAEGQQLVGIGLENIVAVAMPDAVLVADKSRTQDVRQAVDILRKKGVRQASEFQRDYRPWGWFESVVTGRGYQVKQLVVYPGGKLSLQSHRHRSEHWVVVDGMALVTVGSNKKRLEVDQSIYVPLGEIHRLENPGDTNLCIIEVQIGGYLGEDDITRYEDIYAR